MLIAGQTERAEAEPCFVAGLKHRRALSPHAKLWRSLRNGRIASNEALDGKTFPDEGDDDDL